MPRKKKDTSRACKNGRTSGGQRTKAKREKDRKAIALALNQNRYLPEVAEELGISFHTAYADAAFWFEQWRATALIDINETVQRELQKLDVIEKIAWESFKAGCKSVKTVKGEKEKGHVDFSEETLTGGDPRHLQIMQNCMKQRAELLGLNKKNRGGDDPEEEIFYLIKNLGKIKILI